MIDKVDKRVSIIVAFQFVVLGMKNALVTGVPFLYEINGTLNKLLVGTVLILYIYSFFLMIRRRAYIGMTLLGAIAIISILFTYLFYPQNISFWKEYELRFLIVILPTCYLISKLNTLEFLKKYMTIGSYFLTFSIVGFAFAVYTIGHTILGEYSTYSMSMANVAMLAIMWQLRAFLKEKNKLAAIFAVVGLIVLVLYGSRNQLLAISTYVIFHIIGNTKQKSTGVAMVAIAALFLIVFFKDILLFASGIFEHFGLGSRTLSLLSAGGIDESTQIRIDTHEKLKNLIFSNPLTGLGIAGDEANVGELAHSLFYSIWCTYGLVLGSVFLLIVLIWCYNAHKHASGLNHQIFVMYFCMVFPRAFSGGDIWGSDVFWVLVGICFMILNQKKTISVQMAY